MPLPDTVTRSEVASLALTWSFESFASMLKLPTPPPNEAGAPEGRGLTCTVTGGVVMRLRTLR